MNQAEFSQLLSALNKQKTSKDRKTLIQTAATGNTFSCAQVALILENFKFAKDQLQFLKILRPKISDIENTFQIIQVFTFALEKKKAGEILGQPEYIETAIRGKQVSEKSKEEDIPAAMAEESFSQLLDALLKQKFPKEQLYLVELAAFRNTFTSEQSAQIVEKFQSPRYQQKALNILRYRITDPQNHFVILNAFSNSLQKKKASALLMESLEKPKEQSQDWGQIVNNRIFEKFENVKKSDC